MRVLAVQNSTNHYNYVATKGSSSRCKPKQLLRAATEIKGSGAGVMGGMCCGGLAGMALPIGVALLGAPVGLGGFLFCFLLGAYGGAYLGDRIECKRNQKPNNIVYA